MKENIATVIEAIAKDLFHVEAEVILSRPDPDFGDFSTNIALKLANVLKRPQIDIANELAALIKSKDIEKVEVAGPGFINIYLTPAALSEAYKNSNHWEQTNKSKLMIVEFSNANPFKEMHLGHLYSAIVGDAIARLLEASGADVKRVSYHGDVGLQVAKWIWAVGEETHWDLEKVDAMLAGSSIGHFYVVGTKAYDEDEQANKSIRRINEQIYSKDDEKINTIYQKGFDFSFKKFAEVLDKIHISFDKRYLESQSSEMGLAMVRDHIPDVFEQSDGAVIYRGEKDGLHTVVFINSQGLPTYGAKDLGLAQLKKNDFPDFVKSIYITGNEQTEYFKVMLQALSRIDPETAKKTIHLGHGFLSLTTGKMSSRTGDIFEVSDLLRNVAKLIEKQYPDSKINDQIFLSAIKYTFLRQRIGSDITFDVKESVSLDGNSGPYIQYAHARARSILDKFKEANETPGAVNEDEPLQPAERYLAMKISEFPEIVDRAIDDLMPHHICTYLYELAQSFNKFYENNRVIDDPRMLIRIELINSYANVLKSGLNLLNIPAPERM